jgi:hypothetical protein
MLQRAFAKVWLWNHGRNPAKTMLKLVLAKLNGYETSKQTTTLNHMGNHSVGKGFQLA